MLPVLLLSALTFLAQAPPPLLKYDAPAEWQRKPPSSRMRLADFVLPRAEGDGEDATLTIYFFGGQGGSAQANLDRWISQMSQPDGRASKDVATTSRRKQNGLELTIVDLKGTYVAEKFPGSAEHFNNPGFRLMAAVAEGGGGPYYVKVVGPAATVSKWEASVQAFFKSLRVE